MATLRKKKSYIVPRESLLKAGLLVCGTCGYPQNNHFDWGKRPSAHDSKCKAYNEVLRKFEST